MLHNTSHHMWIATQTFSTLFKCPLENAKKKTTTKIFCFCFYSDKWHNMPMEIQVNRQRVTAPLTNRKYISISRMDFYFCSQYYNVCHLLIRWYALFVILVPGVALIPVYRVILERKFRASKRSIPGSSASTREKRWENWLITADFCFIENKWFCGIWKI